jgi:hypothetical protein
MKRNSSISRRDFIRKTAAGVGASVMVGAGSNAEGAKDRQLQTNGTGKQMLWQPDTEALGL